MISIISLIITMSSAIFIILYFKTSNSREIIRSQINTGEICYKCKSETGTKNLNEEPKPRLCRSCERDKDLNLLIGKKDKYFYYGSDRISNLSTLFNIIVVILNSVSLFYKPLGIFGGIFLFIGMYIFYKNYMAITRPKKSPI